MNIIVTLKCGLEVITKSLKVMVPFESLGTVSYSLSAVTMAICLANSEIFSVKKLPDLEIWVWGRSRSLKNGAVRQTVYDSISPPL